MVTLDALNININFQVRFALSVRLFPYPEMAFACWVSGLRYFKMLIIST
jgi:hypothetical protein